MLNVKKSKLFILTLFVTMGLLGFGGDMISASPPTCTPQGSGGSPIASSALGTGCYDSNGQPTAELNGGGQFEGNQCYQYALVSNPPRYVKDECGKRLFVNIKPDGAAWRSPVSNPPTVLGGDCLDADLSKNCRIVGYLRDFINILSAIVGIVSVIMIAVWGIQYTVARDNPQMVAKARLHLLQTVLALVAYLFMYAFLQWVVPGGIF